MGRYKGYSPITVALQGWENLTKPDTISRMISNYNKKINALPSDTDAAIRYQLGVASWTATMREYAPEISRIVAEAKARHVAKKTEAYERVRELRERGAPASEIIKAVANIIGGGVAPAPKIVVPAE